jgi:hypothetical protein
MSKTDKTDKNNRMFAVYLQKQCTERFPVIEPSFLSSR